MICENGYKTKQGTTCLTSCLNNYFNYLHLDSEEDYFLINQEAILKYYRFCEKQRFFCFNITETLRKYLDTNNIDYIYDSIHSKQKALNFLENAVREKKMLTILVPSQDLEYSKTFYNSKTSRHAINIIGEDEKEFYVSDGYIPTIPVTTYEGKIKKDKLLELWGKMEYMYYIWKPCKNSLYIDIEKNVMSFLKKYLQGGKGENVFLGMDAVKQLALDMAGWYNEQDTYERRMFGLNYNIRVYGFWASKVLLRDAITRCFRRISEEKKDEIIQALDGGIEEWNKLSYLIIKAAITRKEYLHTKVVNKINDMIQEEERLYINILDNIKNENEYCRVFTKE